MKIQKSIKFHIAFQQPQYSWIESGTLKEQDVPDEDATEASRALFQNVLTESITDALKAVTDLQLCPQEHLLSAIQKNSHVILNNVDHQRVQLDVNNAPVQNTLVAPQTGAPAVQVPVQGMAPTFAVPTFPGPPSLAPNMFGPPPGFNPVPTPTAPTIAMPPTMMPSGFPPLTHQAPAVGQIEFPNNELLSPE